MQQRLWVQLSKITKSKSPSLLTVRVPHTLYESNLANTATKLRHLLGGFLTRIHDCAFFISAVSS